MKKILVSACLLGVVCRYDGQSKPNSDVIALKDKYCLIPVCPEILGGLPTPRTPCEIIDGRVTDNFGTDKTQEYRRGANEVLRLAKILECDTAILKEKSPACGNGRIYDGTFSKTLINGNGICTSLLCKNGIKIYGESQITDIKE